MSSKEVLFYVEEFRQLTTSCFEVTMRPDPDFTFAPGQFASFVIPATVPGDRDLRRAYSIASNPEKRPIEFCVKLVPEGPGSTYLTKLRSGDRVRGFAPYGHFVYKTQAGRKALMIATGTGIAPFRSMVLSDAFAHNTPSECRLLLGIRDEDELLYVDEMKAKLGNNFQVCMSRGNPAPDHFRGRVTDYVRAQTWRWADWDIYLCGNGAMIHEMQSLLLEAGVTKAQIFKEAYFQPSAQTADASPA